jgi:hypothetical protein
MFIYGLCQELDLDKSELIFMFQEIRLIMNNESTNDTDKIFENYNINKLDIQRMYRYMDKSVKKDVIEIVDDNE